MQRISMNKNKKMKKVDEAILFVYPAPHKALFFGTII
jgi:hypothetical protein